MELTKFIDIKGGGSFYYPETATGYIKATSEFAYGLEEEEAVYFKDDIEVIPLSFWDLLIEHKHEYQSIREKLDEIGLF